MPCRYLTFSEIITLTKAATDITHTHTHTSFTDFNVSGASDAPASRSVCPPCCYYWSYGIYRYVSDIAIPHCHKLLPTFRTRSVNSFKI